MLAKHLGKSKIIAETGAGQHGLAIATVCALMGLECEVHMGVVDIEKQKINVEKMKLLGANIVPVSSGNGTLKDAVASALEAYSKDFKDSIYCIGSVVGPHPFPTIVRDFQSVIGKETKRQIKQFENMGASIIKEAATRANDQAGDGTTTACILTNQIINEGYKAVSSGYNPILIRTGIEKATTEVVKLLKDYSIPITDKKQTIEVASVSSGSQKIGELVGEALDSVGADGIVTLENSNTSETYIVKSQGYEYDRGLASPYMATDTSKMQAVLSSPLILVINKKISTINELLPILEQVITSGKQLLIIADDIENEILGTLVVNKVNGTLPVTLTKAPAFADKRRQILTDICLLTNATLFSDDNGHSLASATLDQLGTAKTIIVSSDKTTIIEGAGDKTNIEAHLASLKEQLNSEQDTYKHETIKERIGKLTGSAAIIYVGAQSEVECNELKLRIEDALSATKAATKEGIVPGGGTALFYRMTARVCISAISG